MRCCGCAAALRCRVRGPGRPRGLLLSLVLPAGNPHRAARSRRRGSRVPQQDRIRCTPISAPAPRFAGQAPSYPQVGRVACAHSLSRRVNPKSARAQSREARCRALAEAAAGLAKAPGRGRTRLSGHALSCRLSAATSTACRKPRADAVLPAPRVPPMSPIDEVAVGDLVRKAGRRRAASGRRLTLGPRKAGSRPIICCAPRWSTRPSAERADELYERLDARRGSRTRPSGSMLERELVAALTPRLRARASSAIGCGASSTATTSPTASRTSPIDSQSGLQLAGRRAHRQAEGLPLERLAAPRHRQPGRRPPGIRSPASPTRPAASSGRRSATTRSSRSPTTAAGCRTAPRSCPTTRSASPTSPCCVPADALMPEAGTRQARAGRRRQGRDRQGHLPRLASAFQDGTEMEPADLALPLRARVPLGRGRGRQADLRPRHRRRDQAAARAARRRARRARRGAQAAARRPHRSPIAAPIVEVYLNSLASDARGERADRPAVELGALARAGADGGRGRARDRAPSRRPRRRGAACPGSISCATRRSSTKLRGADQGVRRSGYRPAALEGLVSAEAANGALAGARHVRAEPTAICW